MKRTLISVLVANLFVAAPALFATAQAADDFTLTGTVGIGGQFVGDTDTVDQGKLREYRDMTTGALSVIELNGRSSKYYLNAYGENLGRDDMFLSLKGGAYGLFKYELFSDSLKHVFTTGARSPYSGIGTANQTINTAASALTTVGNPANWGAYDSEYKRRNDGGALEFSFGTPFYVRLDANQITFDGNKLQSYAKGTSPGNGFVDFAIPVDWTTKNLMLEAGYATKQMQLSLQYTDSKFENSNPVLRWSNNFFVGTDASPLAPDSDQKRWSANAIFKRLPLNSTLALRYTQSKTENDVAILPSMLSLGTATAGTNPTSNATPSAFSGEVKHTTYSLSLTSNPARNVDSRLYYNHLKKENESTKVEFIGLPANFGCGEDLTTPAQGGPISNCSTELFSYKKDNYGIDVGWRVTRDNKLAFGYDHAKTERDRIDASETKENKYSVEWKNTTLDNLVARLKYTYWDRRSNDLETNAGINANDPEFINRFVKRYDISNFDRDYLKLGLDFSPAPMVDLGLEISLKTTKYKDTTLGRTKDDRQEIYFNVAFGDRDVFRVTAFADYEQVKYDSFHRTISSVSGGPTATNPLAQPNTFCNYTGTTGNAAFINCFDPSVPAVLVGTTANFNWSAKNKDTNTAFGIGFDWPVREQFKLNGSAIYVRSEGSVDVTPQLLPNGGNPWASTALPLIGIGNYGNNEKYTLNLKGTYRFSPAIELTAGYAYEELKFNDIQFANYTYVVPVAPLNNASSYLSGWYANPNYKANIVYLFAKYRF